MRLNSRPVIPEYIAPIEKLMESLVQVTMWKERNKRKGEKRLVPRDEMVDRVLSAGTMAIASADHKPLRRAYVAFMKLNPKERRAVVDRALDSSNYY